MIDLAELKDMLNQWNFATSDATKAADRQEEAEGKTTEQLKEIDEAYIKVNNEITTFSNGLMAAALLTMIVLFIVQFVKLGAAAGNAQKRSQILRDIMILAIVTALLGGISLLYTLLVAMVF